MKHVIKIQQQTNVCIDAFVAYTGILYLYKLRKYQNLIQNSASDQQVLTVPCTKMFY